MSSGISTSSVGGISGALDQITQIEQQLQQLQSGSMLSSLTGTSSGVAASATADTATTSTNFADTLAQAQEPAATTAGSADSSTATGFGSVAQSTLGTATAPTGTYTGYYPTTGYDPTTATGGAALSSGATLPQDASTLLTSSQQQFASALSADTGLSPSVVSAWVLAEESGGAAQSRQAAGNNDWLNIGYTDSGTYGSSDSVWSDPVSAANATAGWLKGQDTIPGYGTASSGIQSILDSVGQSPETQISALQNSGWASSGYPDLDSLYQQLTAI